MATTRNNYAWLAICLASIFICLKTEASPLTTVARSSPLEASQPAAEDPFTQFNIDDTNEIEASPKHIVVRSADADDNTVDGEDEENKDKDDKTEKPSSGNSEEIFPDDNKNHHQSPHAHGSHGGLGPVKHLLNTVRDRFHGGGGGALGGIGAVHSVLGNHHESPIETSKDRTMINSSTGLHVLEFLGTIFGLVWGFLSNIPALFGSSSGGASGGQ